MHLNDLCAGTGNQFNLIQQPTYPADALPPSAQSINQQQQQPQSANLHTSLNTSLNAGLQSGLPNQQLFQGGQQLADNSSQLNSSLSSSSGVGCTSSSSSGLGTTSSLFSSNSSSGLSNNPNHSTMNGNSNLNGGSLANHHVLLPLADLNGGGHGLQRAQLISNLNGSSNQYTTLTFPNNHHYYSSTSSPSSVNTVGTGSTLPSTVPINGQSANQSANNLLNASLNGSLNGNLNGLSNKQVYAVQNAPLLSNDSVYCQTTSFTNSAIMDNNSLPVTGHYQLLTNKHQQSNYHLPNGLTPSAYSTLATHHSPANSYLLQTVPANQSPNYAGNLHPPSLNYLNHDDLNKQGFNLNPSAQFDLICDNRLMSPVYSKLSPNSNSLIKECLITNAENALNRNSSKFIELTSSQNSTVSVYSDTLKSRLAGSQSSKDNLKLLQAASTGLDLLNCDKTYNEIIKSGDQLKGRTDSLGKLADGRCKEVCKNRKKCKNKCSCRPVKSDKSALKDQACQQQCQLATKVVKSGHWCCSSSGDNPRKQGIWLILLATCILVLLLGFLTLTTSSKFTSLLGKSRFVFSSATLSGRNSSA